MTKALETAHVCCYLLHVPTHAKLHTLRMNTLISYIQKMCDLYMFLSIPNPLKRFFLRLGSADTNLYQLNAIAWLHIKFVLITLVWENTEQ